MAEYYGQESQGQYAKKGTSAAGLGFGIAGTALGLGALTGGGLGNILGGRRNDCYDGYRDSYCCDERDWRYNERHFESKESAGLRQENAALSATLMAERGDHHVEEKLMCKINDLEKEICNIKINDAYVHTRLEDQIKCMPKTRSYLPENAIVHKHGCETYVGCGCDDEKERD